MTTEPPALGGTEVLDVWSEDVGDTFRLFVGRCGPAPRATLVVADGNGLFGLAVDAVRLMQIPGLLPSLAVVGVGHPGAATVADTVGIRERDLTPTAWPAFPGSGGAAAFLRFVREPVLDRLGDRFPGCLATMVFFGHSLGGLFGTWALLQQPPPFTHYVLSSPSLYWDRYAVLAASTSGSASWRTTQGAAWRRGTCPPATRTRPRGPGSTWSTTCAGSPSGSAAGSTLGSTWSSPSSPASSTRRCRPRC
jgi:predicted alpha/beta superfamily hydrolase